jgi:hypothetical protein
VMRHSDQRRRASPCALKWADQHLTAPDGIDCARMSSLQISNKGDRPWNRLARAGSGLLAASESHLGAPLGHGHAVAIATTASPWKF